MIKLTGAILVFFLAAAPTAYAAELCTPMRLEHKRIDDRATVMHFPEDRVVTLIGHDHGDRGDIRRFSTRLQSPDNEQSTDSWEQGVDDFLRENQTALLHATEDLGYLRASLWQAKEPIFVAIEARERKVAAHLDAAGQLQRALMRAMVTHGQDDLQLMRQVELIAMGAPMYTRLYDAELHDRYELVGLEGAAEGVRQQKVGDRTMRNATARLGELKDKPGYDAELMKKALGVVVDEMNDAYTDIANILFYDHEVIRGRFTDTYADLNPQVRGAALSYLFGYLDFLRGMKKRDIAFSRKLANQARSGIMFVGEEHLASLTNLLEIQCKEVAAGGTVPEGPVEIEDIEEM